MKRIKRVLVNSVYIYKGCIASIFRPLFIPVPHQVLSRDSVTVSVDAVVYYRVSNPTMVRFPFTTTSCYMLLRLTMFHSRPQTT